MRKKISAVFIFFMVMVSSMSITTLAYNYEGSDGLLGGKSIGRGWGLGNAFAAYSTNMTDNNLTTGDGLNGSYPVGWYRFSSPVTISAIYLNTNGLASTYPVVLYGLGDVVLANINAQNDGLTEFASVNNVTAISLTNNAGGELGINEWDAYGALPDTTPPGDVSGLTETHTETTASLSWTNPTNPDFNGLKVYKDGIYLETLAKTETSYNVSGLNPGTSYTYKISTVDDLGNESTGKTISFNTLSIPPSAPTDIKTTASNEKIVVEWNPVPPPVDKYRIYRDGVLLQETAQTTYTDTNVVNGTKYKYEVSAVNANGESGKEFVFAVPNNGIDFTGTSLPFDVPDMIKTSLNYIGLIPDWLMILLAVIFAPVLYLLAYKLTAKLKEKYQKDKSKEGRQKDRRSKAEKERIRKMLGMDDYEKWEREAKKQFDRDGIPRFYTGGQGIKAQEAAKEYSRELVREHRKTLKEYREKHGKFKLERTAIEERRSRGQGRGQGRRG